MILSERRRAVLWLHTVAGLTSAKINRICEVVAPETLIKNPAACIDKLKPFIGESAADKLRLNVDAKQIDDVVRDMERKSVKVIVRGDEEYPESLERIDVPPALLYCIGDINLLKTKCLGVVGTRNPSRYGRDYTESFVSVLAKCKLTIVSGLARGVDGVAHRTTIDNGGKTIAVLGCGVDIIFPSVNTQLYDDIAKNGLIISEYPLGMPALSFNFPERNRIISGLSDGILITEAGDKSGSLITADYAIKQGRDIFIIPSALNSPRGAGGNKLLRACQGAMVLSPDDIVTALGLQRNTQKASVMQLDFTEEQLLDALSFSDMHFDDILALTGLGVSDLNALLVRMEIMGLIKKLDNNFYGV